MAYRKIGEATTNADGIATITYTGRSSGLVQMKAVYTDETSERIESEVFELYDAIKYDIGTQSNHNDMWNDTAAINRGTNYTTIYNDPTVYSDAILRYCIIPFEEICIEFDVYIQNMGTSYFASVRYGTTGPAGISKERLSIEEQTWTHIKCELKNGTILWTNTNNGATYPSSTGTPITIDNYNRFYFRIGVGEIISFKNFVVYKI